jgi:hypothetical protein
MKGVGRPVRPPVVRIGDEARRPAERRRSGRPPVPRQGGSAARLWRTTDGFACRGSTSRTEPGPPSRPPGRFSTIAARRSIRFLSPPRCTMAEWPESVMKRFQRIVERVECFGVAIQPFRKSPQRRRRGWLAIASPPLSAPLDPSRVDPALGVMSSVRRRAIRSYGTFRWSTYFGRRQDTSRFRPLQNR